MPNDTAGDTAVQQLQDLRQKLYNGEEVTPEEYEQVLTALRAGRRAGAETATAKKKRNANAPATIDTEAVLGSLSSIANSTTKE